jgi:hypothetical protein
MESARAQDGRSPSAGSGRSSQTVGSDEGIPLGASRATSRSTCTTPSWTNRWLSDLAPRRICRVEDDAGAATRRESRLFGPARSHHPPTFSDTVATPLTPIARAAAGLKSMTRPCTKGPRSLMRTTTDRPV